ncbi:putative glycosyltransferase, group 1 [Candidatus Filomicrobium marinum]|uniref:Putative glycosyltransferase, group 1 n=1 Tax=Candidatus Filomicrobium marinum TaxID=1608628 RepID=A0A0D6JF49_9HYPH|nr:MULTISPECIES: glycosyltransferase family 4 protein [Filomicrobium]MCV0367909.1 glycosyltransferase family 4 protein [Filomicrobium sp.]CFX18569.1 putative glycosyltransferase, group 1 [Candidatus Filomicrobium marinum]CPR18398.1 putative glycosyltransferase, group 1 [Candidatus Filomicrobium marinum]
MAIGDDLNLMQRHRNDQHSGKILLLISEDWFALSHFKPLIATLREFANEVVIATRSSGRFDELEALGARVVPFDFRRSSLSPLRQAGTVRSLAQLIAQEQPDVVHVVAMQPMVLSALALRMAPRCRVVMHLTGLGFLGISEGMAARVIRPAAFAALGGILGRPDTWLLAENPDDRAYLTNNGIKIGTRSTVLGGAGIDIEAYPALPPPTSTVASTAFVGRIIRSKGLETLAEAARILRHDGTKITLKLYGKIDHDNPDAISEAQVAQWQREGLLVWHGHVSDVRDVWADTDICVLPAITREGMPRAVLEAAACSRPLIVTDVPGCRHFVRNAVEGYVVPAGDAQALATALARLVREPNLRVEMGKAARERVLSGFTLEHVQEGIRSAYSALLAQHNA